MESKIFKARASMAGLLMTDPRSKADKEAGELSETAKTFIEDTWLKNTFGYEETVVTSQMMKGNLCEPDAVQLINKIIPYQGYRSINQHKLGRSLENDYFTGTYDLLLKLDDIVEDIKCPFTVKTFFSAKLTKLYYTQLQVYMDLAEVSRARLIYALVDTPEEIVRDEEVRLYYKFGANEENPDYIEKVSQLKRNHTPSKYITETERVKYYEFSRNDVFLDELKRRVARANNYYNSLSLNMIDDSEILKMI